MKGHNTILRYFFKNASVLLIALLIICTTIDPATAQKYWQGLKTGPYDVGFMVDKHPLDTTLFSGFPGSGGVQIAFWYPASHKAESDPMKIKHYLDLSAWDRMDLPEDQIVIDTSFQVLKNEILDRGVDPVHFSQLIKMSTIASRNAIPIGKSLPLIVIAQGYGGAVNEHFILAEYLASHGFIVGSASSVRRTNSQASGQIVNYLPIMEMVVDEALSTLPADSTKIGLIGYSLCGACITSFHENLRPVNALLSLDGWEGFGKGAKYIKTNRDTSVTMNIPYFYLAEDPEVVKKYNDSPTEWDHSEVRRLTSSQGILTYFRDLRHIDFTSGGMLEFIAPNYTYYNWQKEIKISNSKPVERVYELVKLFMTGILKENQNALFELSELLSTSQDEGIIIETPVQNIRLKE